MTPTVSVFMPVYNAERYVAAAVESILAQTFRDFEFVIIDDGSTDGSRAILERYAARDDRIRLVSRPNKGLVPTRREGLELLEGELIALMDADDISLPERFALQLAFLREHPEVTCVGGSLQVIDSAGRVLLYDRCPPDDESLQEMALSGRTLVPSTTMMRRESVLAVGGYDPEIEQAEDLNLLLKLGEHGKLATLPEFILKYRIHDQSVSAVHTDEQMRFVKIVTDRACDRRGIERRFQVAVRHRAGQDRGSKCDFSLKYGWWGFITGERGTALHYALQAIRWAPWRPGGWHLLACSVLKPVRREG